MRRLYEGNEANVISVSTSAYDSPPTTGSIDEIIIVAAPAVRNWMRWIVRDIAIWLRERVLKRLTVRRVQQCVSKLDYDVLHVMSHGPYSAALCDDRFCKGKQLWVSFHDHFSTTHSNFEDTRLLWRNANRRLLISDELGREYQRLFGNEPYTLITDGVTADEISAPSTTITGPVTIYFAGLLHLEYRSLFAVLADALDKLTNDGSSFKLILRATQNIDFLNNRLFEVEYKPMTLNDKELKDELDAADILYLPIKFTVPDFYLYSLSTKMVGYLGGSGAILYHGPADSAACKRLLARNAAAVCTTLNVDELVDAITGLLKQKQDISANAKQLAFDEFSMETIRRQFWQ